MEMMRWSARRKLLVIPSSFSFISSKYTSPLSSSKLLSSSSSAPTTTFSFSTKKPILFQTRYLHVNPPNQGWFDRLGNHFKNKYMETVPFTKRPRFLVFSLDVGDIYYLFFKRHLLECMLEALTITLHPESKQVVKILPDSHPQSVRVKWILQDILDALGKNMDMKEDVKATTQHINGLRWEISVIDHPWPTAFCLPGGIIFVCSGILKHFYNDGEIAMIIGHEVGHIVADHHSERITNIICYPMIKLISLFPINLIPVVEITNKIQQLLRYRASSLQLHVMEADYIGLILMAWAGYDPTIAPKVFEKFAHLIARSSPITNPSLKKLVHEHYPSCEERVHFLNQSMGQALHIQNQVKASHWILARRLGGLRLIKK